MSDELKVAPQSICEELPQEHINWFWLLTSRKINVTTHDRNLFFKRLKLEDVLLNNTSYTNTKV